MARLLEGFVEVANPFNPRQVKLVCLRPESVDAFVFWTRNARPLIKHLSEIDGMGHAYYFLYTITGYPRELEPNLPPLQEAVKTFKELSDRIGPHRVIWRYDPIVLSSITDEAYHIRNFEGICGLLAGYANRVIISLVDPYKKAEMRLMRLAREKAIHFYNLEGREMPPLELAAKLRAIAESHGLAIQSCAEEIGLSQSGIPPGKCIDDELIGHISGRRLIYDKDLNQRKLCPCTKSIDIGAYNACDYKCSYCYANRNSRSSRKNTDSRIQANGK